MSAKEIFAYRRDGNLIEAYKIAKLDLSQTPDDEWVKKAASWVFIDYLKQATENFDFEKFENYSNELFALNLPVEEKMLYENYSWIIFKWLSKYAELLNNNISAYNENKSKIILLLDFVIKIKLEKPNKLYSIILSKIIKLHPSWKVLNWFGIDCFMPADYLPFKTAEGREIMSVVEQVYIFYSKKILEGEAIENTEENYRDFVEKFKMAININLLNWFTPFLDKIIIEHPEYTYLPFFKAKLLIAMHEKDEDILKVFIPFARKKRNDFWVWDLLSDIFPKEDEKKLACLCKSLTCKTKEDFLVKTHQKMAQLLINLKLYNEAKTEIKKVLEIRNKNAWNTPPIVINWMKNEWYSNANESVDNSTFYQKYTKKAEEILFSDSKHYIIAVEFINKDKRMLSFVTEDKKIGYFKYHNIIEKINIGDILKVRFETDFVEGFNKCATAEHTNETISEDIIRSFKGSIQIRENQKFGFIDNIFVEPNLVERFNLENNQSISGIAICSFNKTKNTWGWKVIKIELL